MATGESENDAFFAQLLADLEHDEKERPSIGMGYINRVHPEAIAERNHRKTSSGPRVVLYI